MNLPALIARAAAALLLATAAVVSYAAPAATAAEVATTEEPAEAAAGWLAGQLTGENKDHFVFAGGDFADIGLTIDAVFAFDAAGVAGDAARRATAFVRDNASSYVGFGEERFAGSYAKLLLLAEAQAADVSSFGGLDLPAELTALECGATRTDCATTPGRYANKTGATGYDPAADFSSPLTQALAVIALHRTTSADPSATAITYLLSEACPDGGYPSSFAASRGGAACTSDPDVTGFVIQGLFAVGRGADAQPAVTWLSGRQAADGSFGGSGATAKANANSTAVAAQALRVAGQVAAANKAVEFLLTLQAGCAAKAGDRGQIAYDKSGSGDPVRATAQAVLGLTGTSLSDVSVEGITAAAPRLTCPEPDGETEGNRDADLTEGGRVLADTGAHPGVVGLAVLLMAVGTALLRLTRRRPDVT